MAIKKILLMLVTLLSFGVSSLYAQDAPKLGLKASQYDNYLEKGRFTTGVNFNYGSGANIRPWEGTAHMGYFFAKHWVGGVQLTIGKNDYVLYDPINVSTPYLGRKATNWTIMPELYSRYYFTSYRFRPFVQVSAGYASFKSTEHGYLNEKTTINSSSITYGAGVGVSYQVSKRIMIEALYNAQFHQKKISGSPYRDSKVKIGVSLFF